MRELTPITSFINSGRTSAHKRFLVGSTSVFERTHSLQARALAWLLGTRSTELFQVDDETMLPLRLTLDKLITEGFIGHYGEGPVFGDHPKFFYAGIRYRTPHGKETVPERMAWGAALPPDNPALAFTKALGEALERHASIYDPAAKEVFYPRIMHGDASLLYAKVPKFTHQQTTHDPMLVKSPNDLSHTTGFFARSITGDTHQFFPLHAFYWGFPSTVREKLFHDPTTNGGGGGITETRATCAALYELIERDHFLLYWFSGVHPHQIATETIPGEFGSFVRSTIRQFGLEVYFLDLRHDTDVLVSACVIIDPVLRRITMGAKAGLESTDVLRGSFLEALAVLSSSRMKHTQVTEKELQDILDNPPFTHTIGQTQRIHLYMSSLGIERVRASFLNGDSIPFRDFTLQRLPPTSDKTELAHLTDIIRSLVAAHGNEYHAYIHAYDSVWLRRLNYHAVRVFIPAFLKLHLFETRATPLSPRLATFMKSHGKPYRSEADINPLPHFFP